jgi:hypothetical protein
MIARAFVRDCTRGASWDEQGGQGRCILMRQRTVSETSGINQPFVKENGQVRKENPVQDIEGRMHALGLGLWLVGDRELGALS